MYMNTFSKGKYEGAMSEWNIGVKQGKRLSPFLFNIFLMI